MAQLIVVGALVRDGRVLLGHRRADRLHFPDCWDLPGGHVEPGELPADALVRELREETGVVATVAGSPSLRITPEPRRDHGVILDVWTVRSWLGDPRNTAEDEHDELRWCDAGELPHLDLGHPEYTSFLLDLLAGSR